MRARHESSAEECATDRAGAHAGVAIKWAHKDVWMATRGLTGCVRGTRREGRAECGQRRARPGGEGAVVECVEQARWSTRAVVLIAGGGALAERSGQRASAGNFPREGEGEVGDVMSATRVGVRTTVHQGSVKTAPRGSRTIAWGR